MHKKFIIAKLKKFFIDLELSTTGLLLTNKEATLRAERAYNELYN